VSGLFQRRSHGAAPGGFLQLRTDARGDHGHCFQRGRWLVRNAGRGRLRYGNGAWHDSAAGAVGGHCAVEGVFPEDMRILETETWSPPWLAWRVPARLSPQEGAAVVFIMPFARGQVLPGQSELMTPVIDFHQVYPDSYRMQAVMKKITSCNRP